MSRLLLTGAQGLLGRSIAQHWLATQPDAEVVGLGRSPHLSGRYTHSLELGGRAVPAGLPEPLRSIDSDPRYHYRSVDLTDPAALAATLADGPFDAIVHSSAALRDESVAALVRANIEATGTLLETAIRQGYEGGFVLISSGSVRASNADAAQTQHLIGAADSYVATKRAGEQLALVLAAQSGNPLVIARVYNLIGAGLQQRHLPALVAARLEAMRRGLTEPVLHLGDLSMERDLVAVDDAARGIVALAAAHPTSPEVVDVGSGRATLMRDLVSLLIETAELTGPVTVDEGAKRPFDAAQPVADVAALLALGAGPRTSLRTSCAQLTAYVRDQWDATG